jgi:putative ABC transport system ATP-binding protein
MVLELKNVTLNYNGRPCINNLSLTVEPGELALIHGPSGSGKTSLLRLINGLSSPQSGTVFFRGKPITDYASTRLRRQISYLQQTPIMVEGTVRQNLLLPFSFGSFVNGDRPGDERLRDWLERLKLTGIGLPDNALNLSVGERQRLAFIRTLLVEPEVLLLDEPVSALDPDSRRAVEAEVERLVGDRDIAVVMISHLDWSPRRLKPRRLLLSDCRLKELG